MTNKKYCDPTWLTLLNFKDAEEATKVATLVLLARELGLDVKPLIQKHFGSVQ